jgi:Calcineurin-like phosphoesterase
VCEYRWSLFPWLNGQIKEHGVKTLLILGDLTDAKDSHSAELVNRVVQAIDSLKIDDIRILAGNHDWLKQGQEFFRFLNLLPHVQFITKPTEDHDPAGPLSIFMPYSKNPAKDWAGYNFDMFDTLFMHQTVTGSIASNGQAMDGESMPALNAGRVYSGDIHVPQNIGGVTYVGSPYHVHVGDNFKPRCMLLTKDGKERDLHFQSLRRIVLKVGSVQELKHCTLKQGDQVKLRLELAEAEKHGWSAIKRECLEVLKSVGVRVLGVELIVKRGTPRVALNKASAAPALARSTEQAVYEFVSEEELGGDALEAALEVIGQ